MVVNDLNQMELIVQKNRSLSWDGWTVVERTKSEKARTANNGIYADGQWYLQRKFEPTRQGWDIPNKYKA